MPSSSRVSSAARRLPPTSAVNIYLEAITSTEATYALAAAAVGFGATLFMDFWALVLKRAFNVTLPDYCLVGRWLCHMPGGRFTHPSISSAVPKPHECAAGWIAHYVVGTAYSLVFLALNAHLFVVRAIGMSYELVPPFGASGLT